MLLEHYAQEVTWAHVTLAIMYSLRGPLLQYASLMRKTAGGYRNSRAIVLPRTAGPRHWRWLALMSMAIVTHVALTRLQRYVGVVSSQIADPNGYAKVMITVSAVTVLVSSTVGMVAPYTVTGEEHEKEVVEEVVEASEQGAPVVVADAALKAMVELPRMPQPKEDVRPAAQYELAAQKNVMVTRSMRVPMTAYSSTVDQTDSTPFITASGTHVHWGTVAANFLPFGTKVRIPEMYGEQIFVVEDRMNKRYTYKMDIWMPSRQQALQFGRRTLLIEVVD